MIRLCSYSCLYYKMVNTGDGKQECTLFREVECNANVGLPTSSLMHLE